MKIVFLCQADWAGSAYQTVQAINSVGRISVRQIVCHKHPFGFDADIILPSVGTGKSVEDCDRYDEACQVLEEADLIHCWNDEYPDFYGGPDVTAFTGTFPKYNEKYKSCTFTGTWYRQRYSLINERLKATRIKLVVQDPSFIMPSMESIFIPHAINTDKFTPLPIDQRNPKTIGCYHQPTTTSNNNIEQLKRVLKQKHPGWRMVLEQKGPNADRLKQLSKCIFFMQELTWGYGRSTLEALALGVPVINRVHPELHNYMDDIPIIYATPEILENSIADAFKRDYRALVQKSREWVIKYHGYRTIGEQYTKFFEGLSC